MASEPWISGRQWSPKHRRRAGPRPLLSASSAALERGGLLERHPHIKADRDQRGAEQERDAPGPGDERLLAKADEEQQKEAGRDKKTDRRPELREHAEPGAASLRRVLDRDQRRAAPFAAEADALHDPQARRERTARTRPPSRSPAGADQRRRHAHRQHGRDQRRLASDPVAEMAEQERPERPGEEGDAERHIGVEGLGLGSGFREEHRPEHERRRSAEDIEIVKLDRRADQARERDLADAAPPRLARRHARRRRHCRFPESLMTRADVVPCQPLPPLFDFKSPCAPYRTPTRPRTPSADSSRRRNRAAPASRATSRYRGYGDRPCSAPRRRSSRPATG